MALVEDTIVYPTIISMLACLDEKMKEQGVPPVCFLGPIEGGDVSMDYCGGECGDEEGACGMAWVRLTVGFASENFPQPKVAPRCGDRIAYTLEVGIARCAPMPESDGTPPSVADHLDAVRLQMADMSAIRKAIACCMGADIDRDYVLGNYTPMPTLGGCTGGYWTVTTW